MQSGNDFGSLDKKSQKEVQSFLEQQQQMQQIQAIVGKITELCWDKCVSKPGKDLSETERVVSKDCDTLPEHCALMNLSVGNYESNDFLLKFTVPGQLQRKILRHEHVRGEPYSVKASSEEVVRWPHLMPSGLLVSYDSNHNSRSTDQNTGFFTSNMYASLK